MLSPRNESCRFLFLLVALLASLSLAGKASASTPAGQTGGTRVHVVFDNIQKEAGMQTSWGFAAVIETPQGNILFDTGADGTILRANMQRMQLAIGSIDTLFISHDHRDHTGGLGAVLAEQPAVTLYVPASSANRIKQQLRTRPGLLPVAQPMEIVPGIYSTGETGRGIREQALVLDTQQGLVIITGCAHPGIADIAERAGQLFGRKIHMLIGGFHLGHSSDRQIRSSIERLVSLGVEKVAPSHCTGRQAMQLFSETWGEGFIASGVGAVIPLPDLRLEQGSAGREQRMP